MARPISRLLLLLTGLSPLSASAAYWQDASTIDWSAVRARTSMQSDPITFRTRGAGSSEKSLLRLSPHERKDQYFHHIRVLDGEIIEHRQNRVGVPEVTGRVLQAITLTQLEPSLDHKQIAHLAKAAYPGLHQVRLWQSELVIALWQGQPRLAYQVSFLGRISSGVIRPVLLLDAHQGDILKAEEALTYTGGMGPGGNGKTGRYQYGKEYPSFDIKELGGKCLLASEHVQTFDLRGGESASAPYAFACYENKGRAVNGAYSPLNDAHAFGQMVDGLYRQWLGVAPLTMPLQMRVHYQSNYENAFWDGEAMTFGDGGRTFYPLVALDVVSHEVSHGFTEQNSRLKYSGQAGGINEAFSDMAGEAAECYQQQLAGRPCEVDWQVGRTIVKGQGALRYMDNPALDGQSIAHASRYRTGMDVHYSSGVFNRAFYLLASTPGWGVQKAFMVFARANQHYWIATSSFNEAACGVIHAAADEQLAGDAVVTAFANVGVQCGSQTPPPPSVEKRTQRFKGTVAKGKWLYFGPFRSAQQSLILQLAGTGDADLYVRKGSKPSASSYQCRPFQATSRESCTMAAGESWYVGVKGFAKVSTITLEASYDELLPSLNRPNVNE